MTLGGPGSAPVAPHFCVRLNGMSEVRHHALIVPPAVAGARLDAALAELLTDYSRTLLKTWIDAGAVRVNGAVYRPRDRVDTGDRIELTATLAASADLIAQALEFGLPHEDREFLVVDKPAGLVVHPGAGNPRDTLVNGLLHRFPELAALPRAGLIHRLDKQTSGLLLVARTPGAFQALTSQMARREIHRTYVAIVHGVVVAGGTVEAAIGRDRVQRTRMRVTTKGRLAVTHYRVRKRFRAHTELEVVLETGRTHQIRVHMQYVGYPLLGDPTYGTRRGIRPEATPAFVAALSALQRQALHASRLVFTHPISGESCTVTSDLPQDLQRVLRALQNDLRRIK